MRSQVLLAFVCASLSAADFSGRYSGTLTFVGSPAKSSGEPLYLVLQQRGNALRGSIGNSENPQNRFDSGTVDGDTATFNFGPNQVRLRLQGASLEGDGRRQGRPTAEVTFVLHRVGDLTIQDRLPPLDYENGARSSRILALREALDQGQVDAVAAFWKSIERDGTPVVETIPDNVRSVLATFLWRGTPKTRSVLLVRGRFTFNQPDSQLFSNIEGTDVWFKTLKLPKDARFTYTLSENDPLGTRPPGRGERHSQYDPLNKRHVPEDPAASKEQWQSLAELPGAPGQPWYAKHEEVPKLTLTKRSFRSEILKEDRDIFVYTPPGYQQHGNPIATVYLFDGEDPDGLAFASQTIENLIHKKRIPPVVVVRIVNPGQTVRNKELACMPEFAEFLARELVPFVRKNYNVAADPSRTAIGGYSMGGLGAAYAGFRHSETFGLLLVQSGSFWWEPTGVDYAEKNWIASQFATKPTLPLKFYMEAGLFEVDLQGTGGVILETSRDLHHVLMAKGYDVQYHEFAGDHDYINWRGTLADGLIALFGTQVPSP